MKLSPLFVATLAMGSEVKCLKEENAGSLPGPCPDTAAQLKIQEKGTDATTAIASACTGSDLTALGYRTDCVYESNTQGKEAACAALPVGTDPTQLAQCLECWSSAEVSEYIAVLFASHANEVCGGDLGETSPVCSDLDCTTPVPGQRNLTGGEATCQLGIGKAGYKYIFKRKGALAGGDTGELSGRPQGAGEPEQVRAVEVVENPLQVRQPVAQSEPAVLLQDRHGQSMRCGDFA